MQMFIFSLESKVCSAAAAFAVAVDVAEGIIFQLPGLAQFSVRIVLIARRGREIQLLAKLERTCLSFIICSQCEVLMVLVTHAAIGQSVWGLGRVPVLLLLQLL